MNGQRVLQLGESPFKCLSGLHPENAPTLEGWEMGGIQNIFAETLSNMKYFWCHAFFALLHFCSIVVKSVQIL